MSSTGPAELGVQVIVNSVPMVRVWPLYGAVIAFPVGPFRSAVAHCVAVTDAIRLAATAAMEANRMVNIYQPVSDVKSCAKYSKLDGFGRREIREKSDATSSVSEWCLCKRT